MSEAVRNDPTHEDVLVCRCEEVRLSDLDRAVAEGFGTPELLKRATRVSMGACQGRVCRSMVVAYWRARGASVGTSDTEDAEEALADRDSRASLPFRRDLDVPGSRPPVRPISVAALADLDPPEEPVTPSQGNR